MLSIVLYLFIAIACLLAAIIAARLYLARKLATRGDGHRGMFVYSDGVRYLSIDPIAAYLALEADAEFRFDLHVKRAAEGDSEAVAILARAVREAFKVPEYSEPGKPGLNIRECHQLFHAFVDYVQSQKKSISPFATLPPSTDATQASSIESDSLRSGLLGRAPA